MERTEALARAERDQKIADYPGCQLGFLQCRSQTCACNGLRPCRAFIRARADMYLNDSFSMWEMQNASEIGWDKNAPITLPRISAEQRWALWEFAYVLAVFALSLWYWGTHP